MDTIAFAQQLMESCHFIREKGWGLGYLAMDSLERRVCPLMALVLYKKNIDPCTIDPVCRFAFSGTAFLEKATGCNVGVAISLLQLLQAGTCEPDRADEAAQIFRMCDQRGYFTENERIDIFERECKKQHTLFMR